MKINGLQEFELKTRISALEINTRQTLMFVGLDNGIVEVYRVKNMQKEQTFPMQDQVRIKKIIYTKQQLVVRQKKLNKFTVLNLESERQQQIALDVPYIFKMKLNRDSSLLFITALNNFIYVYDTKKWELQMKLEGSGQIYEKIIFDASNQLCFATSKKNEISVWDYQKQKEIDYVQGKKFNVNKLIIAQKQNTLYLATQSFSVLIWKFERNQYVHLKGHTSKISCMKLDEEECYLYTTSSRGELIVWDVRYERMVKQIQAHMRNVTSLIIDPYNHQVITSSVDNMINFWKCKSLKFVTSLANPLYPVKKIILMGRRNQLIAAIDSKICLYNFDDIFEYHKIQLDADKVFSCFLSGNDKSLWAHTSNNEIVEWCLQEEVQKYQISSKCPIQ